MMEPVLDALAYVHSEGLVHGHIKPANILASGNVVKLSSDMLQPPGRSLMKSPAEPASAYDAPEVASKGLSQAADVWSIGATVVEAVTLRPSQRPTRDRKTIPIFHDCPTLCRTSCVTVFVLTRRSDGPLHRSRTRCEQRLRQVNQRPRRRLATPKAVTARAIPPISLEPASPAPRQNMPFL